MTNLPEHAFGAYFLACAKLNCFFLQRTGALSLPQRTGPLLPLPRPLTGVVPLLIGLKTLTVATIKVFCTH